MFSEAGTSAALERFRIKQPIALLLYLKMRYTDQEQSAYQGVVMASKKISLTDNTTIPPKSLGAIVLNQDSNGRLTLRNHLPMGISQSVIDSICRAVYIGMKNGNEGKYTWSE